jgi:hypothetical protein
VLRFTTDELAQLADIIFGDRRQAPTIRGNSWITETEARFRELDVGLLRTALALGLKKADGYTRLHLPNPDDVPFGIAQAAEPVIHALLCAVFGTSYADLKAELALETQGSKLLEKPKRRSTSPGSGKPKRNLDSEATHDDTVHRNR